jgi:hypothetical protein
MDNDLREIMEAAIKLKADNKILQGIIDYVLDASRLDYTGDNLRLDDTDGILLFVKVFFADEYDNRVRYLQEKAAEAEKKAAELMDQLEEA